MLACRSIPGKYCLVGAGRYVDPDIWAVRKRLVINCQTLAKVYSAETHHRVFTGFVVRSPAKDLLADHSFPKQGRLSGESVVDDVLEKVLALLGRPKRRAGEQIFQSLPDLFGFRKRERGILDVRISRTGFGLDHKYSIVLTDYEGSQSN
jgi:hypothetical protein